MPAAVGYVFVSFDEPKSLQFGELAADGCVVAAHLIGQLRNAQGSLGIQHDEQCKERAVEAHARLAQERIVAPGAVQESEQVDERQRQPVQIMCILHLYATACRFHIPCMIHTPRILVIAGSTRPQRICPAIAQWVAQVGRETIAAQFEVIDLKDWPLPMDDEPGVPALHGYGMEHTRAWSRKISEADGFVFVSPQYNWGYPAPLKNALDHLYKEWSGKPALIVTYGGHGGGKCARQLRQVLKGLKMKPVATMPAFFLSHDQIEANTGTIDPAAAFTGRDAKLRNGLIQLAAALRGKHRWTWLRRR